MTSSAPHTLRVLQQLLAERYERGECIDISGSRSEAIDDPERGPMMRIVFVMSDGSELAIRTNENQPAIRDVLATQQRH